LDGQSVLGVLLVPLKGFEAGREQILDLRIAGQRNEPVLERVVDGFVMRHLVLDVGLRIGTAEPGEFSTFVGGLFIKCLACVAVAGVTSSFLIRTRAWSFTALWSRACRL
jgi:hypothetical protein